MTGGRTASAMLVPTAIAALVPTAIAAYLLAAPLAATAAVHPPAVVVVLAGLYLLLALALTAALALGAAVAGRAGAAIAGWGVATVLVFHQRESTFWPSSIFLVPVVALAAAPLLYVAARAVARPLRGWRPAAAVLALTALTLPLLLAAASRASGQLRWHLLRHHELLGTPLYYLFEPPVADVEARLFALHRDEEPPPTPPVAAAAPAGERPPHVVYVLLDTLRADALAAWGGAGDMPRLDARLADAHRFLDVVASSSWTRPSMASSFTGLLPEEHGARDLDDPLAERFVTLPEVLAARGYESVAFVANVAALGRGSGFAQGFAEYHELAATPYARAGRVRRVVERWLTERASTFDRPVFLYLHFLDPHEPYLAGVEPARKTHAQYAAAYRAELAYLDGELDALLARVAAALPGEEVLVVGSDHGEELGEHGEFGHGHSLYRELVHVPLAVVPAGGGAPGGVDLAERLEGRDVFHLVTALAAGPVDLRAWARERARARRYYSVYYSSTGRLALRPYLAEVTMRAVEEGDDKLVWSAYGDTLELYDRARDPRELANRAVAAPARAAELAAGLDEPVRGWSFPPPMERSQRELEQMRALGYVD